jgi:hypothetical protein
VNTKALSNHYSQLSAEERFQLILAARSRNDEAERERLENAGKRITMTMPDHSPYTHAFQELQIAMYVELLEDAAFLHDCNARAEAAHLASYEAPRVKKKRASTPKPDGRNRKVADEKPAWHRSEQLTYGAGFLFKVKLEGWNMFCERLGISSAPLWNQLQ